MLVSEEYQTDTPDTRLILAEQFADVPLRLLGPQPWPKGAKDEKRRRSLRASPILVVLYSHSF